MQITAFQTILAQRINIRGCEDYKNTFARMESDSTLRFGFKAPFKSISYTKKSKFFCISEALRDALAGPEALLREMPCILYIISHQPFTANDAPLCSPIFFSITDKSIAL